MKFELVEILKWYDGAPELFLLEDCFGGFYLGYYYETNTDVAVPYESFLVVNVDISEFVDIKYKNLPVLNCFEKSYDRFFYKMTTTSNTVSFKDLFVCEITPNMFPPISYTL